MVAYINMFCPSVMLWILCRERCTLIVNEKKTSTVESAIVFFTLDDHAIGPLQNVIMYPTVDRRLSASPAQSLSQKAIS
ncbi:hypothetical protein T09_7411 [Trichinella sp. T9]|nr:hypothetical protein T09_7411 [Trichinella sp. T9]